MTIGELANQARIAAQQDDAIDQRTLANLMHLLGGDDQSGRWSVAVAESSASSRPNKSKTAVARV